MKKGEIYKAIYDDGNEFINLSLGGNDVETFISVNYNTFHENSHCKCYLCKKVEATPMEKKWLLTCIERKIFVPLQKIETESFKFGR